MIVAFTGHRPEALADDSAGAWIAIKEFLMAERPEKVISGMAQGVDTFAFDIAVELGIPVLAAVPWTGHGANWNPAELTQYLARLERATEVKVVSTSGVYHGGIYPQRNRWMVDNCDLLIGVWNGKRSGGTWNCLEYADKVKRDVRLLNWRLK